MVERAPQVTLLEHRLPEFRHSAPLRRPGGPCIRPDTRPGRVRRHEDAAEHPLTRMNCIRLELGTTNAKTLICIHSGDTKMAFNVDLELPMREKAACGSAVSAHGRTPEMDQVSIAIPVDHIAMIHEIQTNPSDEPQPVTLLELVEAVSEVSESEQEVLATVTYMLNSGRVRLSGSFRGMPITKLCG